MNILFFASSNRSYTPLHNVYLEACKENINSFFLYTKESDVVYPTTNLNKYNYDTNLDYNFEGGYIIESLGGLNIPFKPDVLLISRERWQPEQHIIHELKQKYNTKIYVIETSTHLINSIENRIEMVSRAYRYPQSECIDGFFEHSEFAKQRRIDCLDPQWGNKSIVVGNPRFDKLHNINEVECIKKYNIDISKPSILFWGIINTTRKESFKILQKLQQDKGEEYQIFYKPNPQEPTNPLFRKQFNPFFIEGVRVIYEDSDINTISKICDTHIGSISSIYGYPLYFGKNLVSLDNICRIDKNANNFDNYLKETKNGVEDSAKFWMGVFNLKTIQDLENLIEMDRLKIFEKTNNILIDLIQKNISIFDYGYNFLKNPKKPTGDFIKLFNEFNDKKSSTRIIQHLKQQ